MYSSVMKNFLISLFLLTLTLAHVCWSQVCVMEDENAFNKDLETHDIIIAYDQVNNGDIIYPPVIHLPLNHALHVNFWGKISQNKARPDLDTYGQFTFSNFENIQEKDLPLYGSLPIEIDDPETQADLYGDVSSMIEKVSKKITNPSDKYNNSYDNGAAVSHYEDYWSPKKEGVFVLVYVLKYLKTTPSTWLVKEKTTEITTTVRQIIRIVPVPDSTS